MEELNNTPVLLLRSQNQSFKSKQKKMNRRIRNKKHLREEIYSNHNIFQSTIDLYRNKTAQNLIWDKNYTFKCLINEIKEQNSSLKARIWNIEKENRRMERQIETWNLSEGQTKKPYVDMATVETVLKDQDYHIVSMKIEINKLSKQLHQRQQEHNRILQQNSETPELCRMLNHEIALKKVQMYQYLGGNQVLQQRQSKDKLSQTLMRQNQQLQTIAKNMELKKKSKAFIQSELTTLTNDCNQKGQVTLQEITLLKSQTLKMKIEEDAGLSLQREKLKIAQQQTRQFQCFMQKEMDSLIQVKMPLEAQILQLRSEVLEWEAMMKNLE